jgi:hypothetical protein
MNNLKRGLIVAVVHVLIVCSLGAKLVVDRARCPRVWVKTASYDPNLPIRGRYVNLRIVVDAPEAKPAEVHKSPDGKDTWMTSVPERARLDVRDGKLLAIPDEAGSVYYSSVNRNSQSGEIAIDEPVAFFIPDTAQDPTRRKPGEELWAEVTVPRKGPPRPISLAVKNGGEMHRLDLK